MEHSFLFCVFTSEQFISESDVAPEWVATQFPSEIAFGSKINAALPRFFSCVFTSKSGKDQREFRFPVRCNIIWAHLHPATVTSLRNQFCYFGVVLLHPAFATATKLPVAGESLCKPYGSDVVATSQTRRNRCM